MNGHGQIGKRGMALLLAGVLMLPQNIPSLAAEELSPRQSVEEETAFLTAEQEEVDAAAQSVPGEGTVDFEAGIGGNGSFEDVLFGEISGEHEGAGAHEGTGAFENLGVFEDEIHGDGTPGAGAHEDEALGDEIFGAGALGDEMLGAGALGDETHGAGTPGDETRGAGILDDEELGEEALEGVGAPGEEAPEGEAIEEAQLEEISGAEEGMEIFFALGDENPSSYQFAYVNGVQVDSMRDGTADWDSSDGNGCDSNDHNKIVRSYDKVIYNLKVSYQVQTDRSVLNEKILCRMAIPDYAGELRLSGQGIQDVRDVSADAPREGYKTYEFSYTIPDNDQASGSGYTIFPVTLDVLGLNEGDTITPEFTCWLEKDETNTHKSCTAETVTVTTAPHYNVVLDQRAITGRADYTADGKTVVGYAVTYGFGVEMAKADTSKGIRGIEFPSADPDKPITFSIRLGASFGDTKVDTSIFKPVLYRSLANDREGDNTAVEYLPATRDVDGKYTGRSCLESGTVSVTQNAADPTKLDVSIYGFALDRSKFPEKSIGGGKTYYTDKDKILEAMFSTWKFTVIYPYEGKDAGGNLVTLQSRYGDGVMKVTAEDTDFHATSVYGTQTSTQTKTTDDSKEATVSMVSGHGRNHQLFYSSLSEWTAGTDNEPGVKENDQDYAALGQQIAWSVIFDEAGNGPYDPIEGRTVVVEQLALFQDGYQIQEALHRYTDCSGGYTCEAVPVYSASSLSYDQLMSLTLDDIGGTLSLTGGGECVGILYLWKGFNVESRSDLSLIAHTYATVKPESQVDYFNTITLTTRAYPIELFQEQLTAAYGAEQINTLTAAQYSSWAKGLNITHDDLAALPKAVDGRAGYADVGARNSYQGQPVYNETKGIYEYHGTNFTWGADTMYIVPYTTQVTKEVAQREGEKVKNIYDIGHRQRYVDYRITSALEMLIEPERVTDVAVYTDTLPEGLSYVAGSAVWGSDAELTYTQAVNALRAGTVSGGESAEPEIIPNEDGTTTLIWRRTVDVKKGALPTLYFSAKIGDDKYVKRDVDGGSYTNEVTVQTTRDRRPISSDNKNISDASITVTTNASFNINKSGKLDLEAADQGYFDLVMSNATEKSETNVFFVDSMPANGVNGTSMTGHYTVTEVSIDCSEYALDAGEIENIEVFFTTNPAYAGQTTLGEITLDQIRTQTEIWTKADKDIRGSRAYFTGTGLVGGENDGTWPAAIAVVDSELKSKSAIILHLAYDQVITKDPGETEMDLLHNTMMIPGADQQSLSQTVTERPYVRSLEGIVWEDEDMDGLIDDGEQKLKDVQVVLQKWDETLQRYEDVTLYNYYDPVTKEIKSLSGTASTGDDGAYSFTHLPEGTFRVRFTAPSGYEITDANVGTDSSLNSKAERQNAEYRADGTAEYANITQIKMPAISDMKRNGRQNYHLPDQNLGLYRVKQVRVQKEWADGEDQDGLRPSDVRVQLYADGVEKGDPVSLNEANGWTYAWSRLQAVSGGDPIAYTVQEASVPAGYTAAVTGSEAEGFTITNTHTPEVTALEVSKIWEDRNNSDDVRPESLTVTLLADGAPTGKTLVLEPDAQGNWAARSFENLPLYKNGRLIRYTVVETAIEGYVTGYVYTPGKCVITNTHAPEKTSVTVTKAWADQDNQDGIRPNSVHVQLYADGTAQGEPVELNAANRWTYTWTELIRNRTGENAAGAGAIAYTVDEILVPAGYTRRITGSMSAGFTITNTHTPELTALRVSKRWEDGENQDGKRPESLTVTLSKNGVPTDRTLTLRPEEDGTWTPRSFENLPKYENGNEIIYTIVETAISDYTTTYAYDGGDGIITNTHAPAKTHVTVTKAWLDGEDQDGKRPYSVQVQLYADGAASGEAVTLSEDNRWTYTWSDLNEYARGRKITYTVAETEVPEGYESAVTGSMEQGFVVTNTHTPELTSLSVSKTWVDGGDNDHVRPASLEVSLRKDGTPTGQTLTLRSADHWAMRSFENLPKYENGREIIYTIVETAVEDYSTTYAYTADSAGGSAGRRAAITNTHAPEQTSVTVSKTWTDGDDQDGERPERIFAQLYADGAAEGEAVPLSEANHWTYTWSGLRAKKDGELIAYTVDEVRLPEDFSEIYSKTITGTAATGYTITNTHTPGRVSVEGVKTWKDNGDHSHLRPQQITVYLCADGVRTQAQTVRPDEDGVWSWSFVELPEYRNKNRILYTVEEETVEGYTARADGHDIINTHYNRTLDGIVWYDKDRDGAREDAEDPVEITVRLYRIENGKETPYRETVSTDGTYRFEELDPGEYKVVFDDTRVVTVQSGAAAADKSIAGKNHSIGGIHMPTDEQLASGAPDAADYPGSYQESTGIYHLPYQNMGVITYTRSISGIAFKDNDKDGEYGTGDQLMAGETVTLLKYDAAGKLTAALDPEGKPITAKTDENGFYRFEGLESGSYRVVFGVDLTLLDVTTLKSTDLGSKIDADQVIDRIYLPTDQEIADNPTRYPTDDKGNCENAHNNAGYIDRTAQIRVRKLDAFSQKDLSGATLQLKDDGGTVLREWITDGNAAVLEGLSVGRTYTIHESKVPEGYETEPNGDVTFLLSASGAVSLTGGAGDLKDGVLEVMNAPLGFLWGSLYPERYPQLIGQETEKQTEKQTEQETEAQTEKQTERTAQTEKSAQSAAGSTAPRTGDETPILLYLVLLLGALAVAGATIWAERRKERDT